ncbi:MAG: hypothetical protein D6696_05330 [Acidobacteria bacterium]|nr:MAG: hypothetical protein D6696_05330 [Acidobacteriota bacterium]
MTDREHLHQLVEALPEDDLAPAVRLLESLRDADPVLQALERAPLDDEPLSPQDARALEEALEDRAQGRIFSHEEVRRSLLGKA